LTEALTEPWPVRIVSWLPHLFVALLAVPFIVGQNAWYEWANVLWLLELQAAHVSAYGLPTFFIHAGGQYFYPQQLFYAGPMLSVLAYPALVFGAWPVFAAAAAASFAGASAGISWAARNLGVPSRLALVPGILFAVTPYTVSNLYGRGDWAELVATGSLAVAIGAATSLLTGRHRSVPGAMAVLALSVAAVAGTHNLTLLFAALLAPALAMALLPVLKIPASELARRFGLVFAAALIGVAICGAFVIPNVWLGSQTIIGHYSYLFLTALHGFDKPRTIFDPLPGQPAGTVGTDLHTQTLVLALGWLLVVGGVATARGQLGRRTQTSLALLLLTGAGVTLLIAEPSWWQSFPGALMTIQFTFRMVTYLALVTVLGIAVLLAIPAVRRSRVALALLLLATLWQVGLAADLALGAKARGAKVAPTPSNVRAGTRPPGYAAGQQGQDRLVVHNAIRFPRLRASVAPVGDGTPPVVHLFGSQPAGSLVRTTVVASPLIRFAGSASVAGVTFNGFEVLRINRSPWHVAVRSACTSCLGAIAGSEPLALLAGRVATLLGALALVALTIAHWRSIRRPEARI
jgi:hypothetical protein